MEKKNYLTKILAIAGTAFVWLPLLAPILISAIAFTSDHILRFDYLMLAELFPAILIGGGLLIWAAMRAHSRQKLIGWGLVIATASLLSTQTLAIVTGLASGETEPVGWPWILILAVLVIYSLSVVAIGVGSLLLLNDLIKLPRTATESF